MPGFDQTKQNTLYVLKFRKFEKKVLKLGRKINNTNVNMGQKKTNTTNKKSSPIYQFATLILF